MASRRGSTCCRHAEVNPDEIEPTACSNQVVDTTTTSARKVSLRHKSVRVLQRIRPLRSTMALTAAFFQQILCWYAKIAQLLPTTTNRRQGHAYDLRRCLHVLRQSSSRTCVDSETMSHRLNSSLSSSLLLRSLGPASRLWISPSHQRARRRLVNCRPRRVNVYRWRWDVWVRDLYRGTSRNISHRTRTELLLCHVQPCGQDMVSTLQRAGNWCWSKWCCSW